MSEQTRELSSSPEEHDLHAAFAYSDCLGDLPMRQFLYMCKPEQRALLRIQLSEYPAEVARYIAPGCISRVRLVRQRLSTLMLLPAPVVRQRIGRDPIQIRTLAIVGNIEQWRAKELQKRALKDVFCNIVMSG